MKSQLKALTPHNQIVFIIFNGNVFILFDNY